MKLFNLKTGNGGNAGSVLFHVRRLEGNVWMKSCPGKGAPAAKKGEGGDGKQPICLKFILKSLLSFLAKTVMCNISVYTLEIVIDFKDGSK